MNKRETVEFIREKTEMGFTQELIAEKLNVIGVKNHSNQNYKKSKWSDKTVSKFACANGIRRMAPKPLRKKETKWRSTKGKAQIYTRKTNNDHNVLAELIMGSNIESDVKLKILKILI